MLDRVLGHYGAREREVGALGATFPTDVVDDHLLAKRGDERLKTCLAVDVDIDVQKERLFIGSWCPYREVDPREIVPAPRVLRPVGVTLSQRPESTNGADVDTKENWALERTGQCS